MEAPHLYRIVISVDDIDRAAEFYSRLFEVPGERVSPGRHYFDCGGTILACLDPRADGHEFDATPPPEQSADYIYFSIADLEGFHVRAQELPFRNIDREIRERPWGERSFYATDPFGNLVCFVQQGTEFRSGYVK
jgi:catechol 2,3-dioxygenase-like lactoylglutathione lyase family enzyme